MSLPYVLPAQWRLMSARPARAWVVGLCAAAGVLLLSWAATALLRTDPGTALWQTVAGGFVLCAAGVGLERSGGERGLPAFINAVTLTRAEEAPPDSWIHLFRERGPSRWLATMFCLAGFAGGALFTWTGIVAVVAGAGWLLVLVVPALLAALVVALAGSIAFVQRWRRASFGRRQIGLSVGGHGVIRYFLDGWELFAWDEIVAVRAGTGHVDESTGDALPVLHLDTAARVDALALDLSGYEAHAWLIYTAVRFWAEHPAERAELGTTFAQMRVRGWRDAIAASGQGTPLDVPARD